MGDEWSLKLAFLRTLIAALVSSALVGVYAFLFGSFGKTEVKILLTTLAISYFSVTSLACSVALEKRTGYRWLSLTGLTVSLLGFLIVIPGIWAEFWDSELVGKSVVILCICAFSLAQVLLALVPLKPSIRWLFYATAGVIAALTLQGCGMIIFEMDGEWLFRIAGVLGILDGCGSLLILVLFKLGGQVAAMSADVTFDRVELTCPRCGRRDTYAVGAFKCRQCSLGFKLEVLAKTMSPPPKDL